MNMKKLIIGNWKMNPKTLALAKAQFSAVKKEAGKYKNVSVGISAPCIFLPELSKMATASTFIAAQNISSEKEGAHTGEISADMLASIKVLTTIVGHSERRALGETNEFINKKIKSALRMKMTPVLCVGELERDSGMWYLGFVKTQIEECLAGIPKAALKNIVVAYEPVWAISSTENHREATPADFQEMKIYIQKVLSDMYGSPTHTRVLYGGSVDEKNAKGFLADAGADGLLVGRSSLTPKKFLSIISIANAIN